MSAFAEATLVHALQVSAWEATSVNTWTLDVITITTCPGYQVEVTIDDGCGFTKTMMPASDMAIMIGFGIPSRPGHEDIFSFIETSGGIVK